MFPLALKSAGNAGTGDNAIQQRKDSATVTYEDLSLEIQNHVAIVTLQRPEKMNAMGPRLVHDHARRAGVDRS